MDFYNQKGFFITNENGITPFPELRTLKIGGISSYVFNKNFSFRAIGFQNEWQKKSAGSFIPRFTFYYTKFNLEDSGFLNDSHSFDLAIGPGYYYNWVIKKHFIFSVGGATGIGINSTRTNNGHTHTSALYEAIVRGVVGYNSERFFTGINTNFLFLKHNTNRYTTLDDNIKFLEFYLGYRFNAPSKWVKKADRFNQKYGF